MTAKKIFVVLVFIVLEYLQSHSTPPKCTSLSHLFVGDGSGSGVTGDG